MIDLLLVKQQKEYDFEQADSPNEPGVWLCTETNGSYQAGYSYENSAEHPCERVEKTQDQRIKRAIYPTIEKVCHYLNNWFIPRTMACVSCGVRRPMLTYADFWISPIYDFKANDLIRVDGIRNKYVSYITELNTNKIKVDNKAFEDGREPTKLDLMVLPQALQVAIAQMINYDVFERGNLSGTSLKTETVGSYRYEIDSNVVRIGSLDYPASIANTIEGYARVKAF